MRDKCSGCAGAFIFLKRKDKNEFSILGTTIKFTILGMGCHKSIGERNNGILGKRESSLKLWVSSMYTTMVGVGSLF